METGDTHRLRLTLHYDGSRFHGWQFQPTHRTVQGDLQAALERLTQEARPVTGSGRTDTGVHATGQVVAVDLPVRWDPDELRRALNAVLPRDVWVADASVADPRFHPRFDATARSYVYRVGIDDATGSPFERPWCWPLMEAVDLPRLRRAAGHLVGRHSFAGFAKSGQPHRGEFCTVTEAGWSRWGMGVQFRVSANRYLHHMVRYLVGTMIDVGRDKRPESDVPGLLARKPGLITSAPAPSQGLFLAKVEYLSTPRSAREADPDPRPSSVAPS